MAVDTMGLSEARELLLLEQRLTRSYGSVAEPDVVRQLIRKHVALFDGAPVRIFVPLLVERAARSDLDATCDRCREPAAVSVA